MRKEIEEKEKFISKLILVLFWKINMKYSVYCLILI